MTLAPGTKLGPYEILAPIGAGGMGEVWKARDTRLGRIVAIKNVKEQHSERFKQEARSIAALNHPNICQLHDIGPDYLVLEYVEGKPLSSPLPEREAVRLAIQIATALEEAHGKGIIHRDLKPSNIMVTDKGTVKLLDFGLAKLYEQDAASSQLPTADFPATQAGAVLGTVAYMSPEQAQGQPADARSDIFSFGLVLYEILSGRKAFTGETPMAVGAALIKEEPSAIQASAPLQEIVRRCLWKQPSGRYQTITEVKTALEKVFADKASQSSAEPQPSIAVLPFVNMSGDKEQEYFSDGLAEEIINALTHIPGLRVAGRTSSFFFRGKDEE
jgi:eukaryotic-like serine/threonine-protein kinase